MPRHARPVAPGLSLVECILALAIVAGAILGIGGVLVEARRLVAAGRRETAAVAVARGLVEELRSVGFDATWRELGLDGSTSRARVDARSAVRTAPWQAALDRALGDAKAEVELESIPLGTGTALRDARAVRVLVHVTWRDGLRERRVRLAAVRT